MLEFVSYLAFIGPGGPEILVVMLVLLLMFGAKDAPRIFRKINEMINSVRNTADGFKREIMYGDINKDSAARDDVETYDDFEVEYGQDDDYHYEDDELDASNETFNDLETDLEESGVIDEVMQEQAAPAEETVAEEMSKEEDGDVRKA